MDLRRISCLRSLPVAVHWDADDDYDYDHPHHGRNHHPPRLHNLRCRNRHLDLCSIVVVVVVVRKIAEDYRWAEGAVVRAVEGVVVAAVVIHRIAEEADAEAAVVVVVAVEVRVVVPVVEAGVPVRDDVAVAVVVVIVVVVVRVVEEEAVRRRVVVMEVDFHTIVVGVEPGVEEVVAASSIEAIAAVDYNILVASLVVLAVEVSWDAMALEAPVHRTR